jgi:hypothetical protein
MVFKSFSFEDRKKEKFLVYITVPGIFGNCKLVPECSISPLSLSLTVPVYRHSLVDAVSAPWPAKWTPSGPGFTKSALPWPLPRSTCALDSFLDRHATPVVRQRRCWLFAHRRAFPSQINHPRVSYASPRSVAAYK